MNAQFRDDVPVARIARGPSRLVWFGLGFIAAFGIVGVAVVAAVAGVAVAIEKPVPCAHHEADRFMQDLAAGRWTRAAERATPAVAAELEEALKSHPEVFGSEFRSKSRRSTGDLLIGERGVRIEEKGEVVYQVEGKDGKTRDVALTLEGGRVTEIWISGTRVLPEGGKDVHVAPVDSPRAAPEADPVEKAPKKAPR